MLERIKLYSQLMRMDKPIGFFLLMWPVLWAFIISSEGSPNIFFLIIFAVGIIATRSAGCIINDYFDQEIECWLLNKYQITKLLYYLAYSSHYALCFY